MITWKHITIIIRKEYLKPYNYVKLFVVGLVSLFDGISTFMGYLMLKLSLLDSNDII